VGRIEEDEAREQEVERQEELDTGEEERIEESQSGVQEHTAVSTNRNTHSVAIHKLQQMDWVMDIDTLISPVPSVTDFHPKVYAPPNTGGMDFCAQNHYCCLARYKIHDI
jgi:hypothetical protein